MTINFFFPNEPNDYIAQLCLKLVFFILVFVTFVTVGQVMPLGCGGAQLSPDRKTLCMLKLRLY